MLVGFPAIKFSTATSLTQPLAHYSDDPREAVLITFFSHIHLSGDAKDLLYKCTILTAMMRRLTRVLFGHTFR